MNKVVVDKSQTIRTEASAFAEGVHKGKLQEDDCGGCAGIQRVDPRTLIMK